MLNDFSSICISRAVVILLQQKPWREERKSVDKNRTLLRQISWRDAFGYSKLRLGTLPLGATSDMVMETKMTQGLRYLSFRFTIK